MTDKNGSALPPLLQAMMNPAFYPHRPDSVELIQTHISWVFLAGNLVYKVKKPVDFGFLDFTSLAARTRACREEVRLNKRLSTGLYLGMETIYRRGDSFSLSPPGRAVERAVVMRRLPDDRLLSTMLVKGQATEAEVRKVARRIAHFHREAEPALRRYQQPALLEQTLQENFQQSLPYLGLTVPGPDYLVVWDYNRDFLERRRHLLRKRIRDGRVRDGHGDLHAEHICFDRGVQIYDCIEFSPRLRQTDTAADIAFLYMDLLHHGHPHLARSLMEEYLKGSGDWEVRLLLPFYACYRAVVREKVESFRLADPALGRREKRAVRERARAYFGRARRLAEKDARPRLIVMGGLPGSGKSTLAAGFAELIGAVCLNSDVVRKRLAGASPGVSLAAPAGKGIYRQDMTDLTYGEMLVRAGHLLKSGRSVVLDATFADDRWRRRARGTAKRAGAAAVAVQCVCPAALVRRRLELRSRKPGASDADWHIYRAVKARYQKPSGRIVEVNTARTPDRGLAAIAAAAYPF